MRKPIRFKKLALLLSLLLILTTTVQSTLCFVATDTGPVKNTFQPYQGEVSDLIITKTVEHPFGSDYVIPDNIAFDFDVDLGSEYAGVTLTTTEGDKTVSDQGILTVTVKAGASVGIQGIDEGTKVTVTEVPTKLSGFTVKDGASSKEVTIQADETAAVDFVNLYTPSKVPTVNLNVTGVKNLVGRDWQEGDSFSFLLEQQDANGNWVSLGTKSVTYDAGNENFDQFDFSDIVKSLTFDQPGEYSFRISEVVGSLDGVTYDKTVNPFKVVIGDQDMDGALEIQNVTADQNATASLNDTTGQYEVKVTFNNTFVASDAQTLNLSIAANKVVTNTGNATMSPEGFEFLLENTATGDKLTAKSDKNGLVVFDLDYTTEDMGKTYSYKLSELNDGRVGVTYSTAVYDLKVSIVLGADNKLAAKVTVNGADAEGSAIKFENFYQGATAPSSPATGDDSWKLWFAMLISGTAILSAAFVMRKRRETM